jgi:two-component system, chemotaxis family, protein-glutamate methylesterase/glutaminase
MGASGSRGFHDIRDLLALLPREIQAVVLAVLHRPTSMISHLAEVLQRTSSIPVIVAGRGQAMVAGRCYIGEPAEHLVLAASSRMDLIHEAHGEYRNRTVDLLFTSVARHARERAIGIVLEGALDDGSRGLKAIHEAGGITMVVATVPRGRMGMPENARSYDGPVDFVGDLDQIAEQVIDRTGSSIEAGRYAAMNSRLPPTI